MISPSFEQGANVTPPFSAQAKADIAFAQFSAPMVVEVGPAQPEPDEYAAPTVDVTHRNEQAWTPGKEKTFSLLAAKVAAQVATVAEITELKRMQLLRRRLKNPMSTEEIVFQFKRRKMEARLIGDLKSYVEFLASARRSEA